MSKKDFVMLADFMRASRTIHACDGKKDEWAATWDNMCRDLADRLNRHSMTFNRSTFLSACGVES
jgi:hypothetical protein